MLRVLRLIIVRIFILMFNRCWNSILIILFLACFFFSFFCYNPLLIGAHRVSSFFLVDQLSWRLGMLTIWVAVLSLMARQGVYHKDEESKLFLFLLLRLTILLLIAFFSSRLMLFYFFFERRLIPIFFLILLWGYQPERLQAGLYIMIYTLCGSLPLLIGLVLIYLRNGHRRFFMLLNFPVFRSSFENIWFLFLRVAFLVKVPIYGVHLWLPKAHVEAPVAGSMMLAGVLLKLGVFGLLRVMTYVSEVGSKWSGIIIPLSLLGALITRFICLRQTDFKSLIAYSSVAHMRLLVGGVFSYHVWGWEGALMIRVAHGLRSSALFMLANIVYSTYLRRRFYIAKGVQNLFPFMAFWWFIFCARNIAAPPCLNLLREIMLIGRIVAKRFRRVVILISLRFFRAAYSLYLFVASQHGQISSLVNPLLVSSLGYYLALVLHFIPVILLLLGVGLFGVWC